MSFIQKIMAYTMLSLSAGAGYANIISAPLVDNGVYLNAFTSAGMTLRTQHFKGGNVGDHQFTLTGEQQGFLGIIGNFSSNRRSYYSFDVSGKSDPVISANFRVWGWAPNGTATVPGGGVYNSADASETLTLFAVENHTANDIINAPFNQDGDHTIDLPIWEDLGTGTEYGSRVFTAADRTGPGLIASPLSDTTDCSAPGAGDACGRWYDFELNEDALASINSVTDNWVFGASITTINGGGAGTNEQLLTGAPVNLSNPSILNFSQPAPQLILTMVPVPAAVWLFGTALAGLVGVRSRKRSLAN